MAKLTQKERVARALDKSEKRGITQADFLGPDVIDGRAPITRLAARILELEDDGLKITAGGRRDGGCVIYRLAANAVQPERFAYASGFSCLACGARPATPVGTHSGPCPACGEYAVARLLILDEPSPRSADVAA